MANIMNAKDAVSASLAECYVTIEGNRYNLMQAIKLEAKVEKTKSEVPILGKTGKGNKATGWKGTGSATFHYNMPIFRRLLKRYKDTGEDIYFDIQCTNEDPTSSVGRQTVILKDCNMDGGILAKFDADAEYIDEDMDFTFEDFEKMQFQVGEIISCEAVKKSKKLLCSQVKIGSEVKQIVSGIKAHYSPEEMVGKKVMVLVNLKPAKLAGVLSEGMILCAEDENGELALMVPEKKMPAGAEVC